MNNNDKLLRLRYALDLKDVEMVEIFKLGGIDLTKEEVKALLTRLPKDEITENEFDENIYQDKCNNRT